jgi:hypothetical protein
MSSVAEVAVPRFTPSQSECLEKLLRNTGLDELVHLPVVVADLHTLITPRINHKFSLTLAGAVAHLA